MNTNSNSYTIIYASVMVIIVAFLLAFVSSSLKSTQDKNVQLDTKKQILAALNIKNVEDADAEYKKYVKGDMLMNVDGTLLISHTLVKLRAWVLKLQPNISRMNSLERRLWRMALLLLES